MVGSSTRREVLSQVRNLIARAKEDPILWHDPTYQRRVLDLLSLLHPYQSCDELWDLYWDVAELNTPQVYDLVHTTMNKYNESSTAIKESLTKIENLLLAYKQEQSVCEVSNVNQGDKAHDNLVEVDDSKVEPPQEEVCMAIDVLQVEQKTEPLSCFNDGESTLKIVRGACFDPLDCNKTEGHILQTEQLAHPFVGYLHSPNVHVMFLCAYLDINDSNFEHPCGEKNDILDIKPFCYFLRLVWMVPWLCSLTTLEGKCLF